ncbi:MAG TPA: hypothetical protein DEP18_03050 [Flavobacteriales bacterium]|nr:hypothetical protein [Flavobacteriales bacterium]HRE74206.1 T9SS type A sorting domain-containing protein [Flavobacteriales bacterium]HRJ36902.1 T9SS type A sorting domain-containing protein [Flavobacteriales bacterium]HRJ38215.1 T9SS type A sorting domain-containing protein [Flavobacteriales bacterium]
MKKIYAMIALSGLGVTAAQAQLRPATTKAPLAPASIVEANNPNSNNLVGGERTPVWTEPFNIGTTSGSTNGPTWTTGNGVWTASGVNAAVWKHSHSGSTGQYSASTPAFAGNSNANGWMLFDADAANAAQPFTNFTGTITSPIIDLTGLTSVTINFNQMYRFCCASTHTLTLGVSGDGGTSWTDFSVTNPGVATNVNTANPDMVARNVSSALLNSSGVPLPGIDMSQVRIRLTWDGAGASVSHYYWIVDDIEIGPAPDHDLEIYNTNFYGQTTFWDTEHISYRQFPTNPANQFFPQMIIGDVFNVGALAQTNTALQGRILDAGSTAVFTGTDNAGNGTLNPGSYQYDTIRNINISAYTAGTYNVNYEILYDNSALDARPANNTAPATPFLVGGTEFGRDNNLYSGAGLYGGVDAGGGYKAYTMGNVFQITNNVTLKSVRVAFSATSSATTAGSIVFPIVYEHDNSATAIDAALNPIYDGSGTSFEYEILPTDLSTTQLRWVDLRIPNLNLQAGKSYVVAVGTYGAPDKVMIQNGNVNHPTFVTTFIYGDVGSAGLGWYWMTSTPKIRMNFDPTIGVEENESVGGLTVMQNVPNPFTGETMINFSLENAAQVGFEVYDISGKMVYTKNLGVLGAGSNSFRFDGAQLSAGVYYYTVSTPNGKVTKKMIIG